MGLRSPEVGECCTQCFCYAEAAAQSRSRGWRGTKPCGHAGSRGEQGSSSDPMKPWPRYLQQCRWCGQLRGQRWCRCCCSAAAMSAVCCPSAHRCLPQRSRRARLHRCPLSPTGHPALHHPQSRPAGPRRPAATRGKTAASEGPGLRPTAQGPPHSTAPRRQAPAGLTHPVAFLSRGRERCQSPVPETALGPPLGPQHRLLCSLQLQLEVQGAWAEGNIEELAPVPRLTAALHSPRCPVLHPTGTLHSAISRLEHPSEDAKGHVPICGPARRYQKVRQRGVAAGSWS